MKQYSEELERLIVALWDAAKQDATICPSFDGTTILFHLEGGHLQVTGIPTPIVEDKDLVAAVIKEAAKEMDAIGVFFICEAWTLALKKDSNDAKDFAEGKLRVSEMVGRQETLMGLFETATGTRQYMAHIDRTSGKKVLIDQPVRSSELVGRFTGFLKSRESTLN